MPRAAVVTAMLVALALAAAWRLAVPETGPGPAVRVAGGLLAGRAVALDPGHGGPDPGAVGPSGVLEKHVVLAVGLRLRHLLEQAGVVVYLTRTEDADVSGLGPGHTLRERWRAGLRRRVELVRRWQPDVLLSLHANAVPSSRWYGAQVFYRSDRHPLSRLLAERLQEELVHQTGRTRRAPSDRLEHYVLEHVDVPAVTVELGFLSHPGEERLLASPEYQDRLAWALFIGLARYFHDAGRPAPVPPLTPD